MNSPSLLRDEDSVRRPLSALSRFRLSHVKALHIRLSDLPWDRDKATRVKIRSGFLISSVIGKGIGEIDYVRNTHRACGTLKYANFAIFNSTEDIAHQVNLNVVRFWERKPESPGVASRLFVIVRRQVCGTASGCLLLPRGWEHQ